MSYAITVKVENGSAEVSLGGPVSDGSYSINGHIDSDREDLTAQRNTVDGRCVSRISTTVYKEV